MGDPRRSGRRRAAEWWRDVQWYALAVLVAVVFALGVAGFLQLYAEQDVADATLSDAVYESIQLFILESGAVEPPVPPILNVARYLGAFAFFYGAVAVALTVFSERIARFRLRMSKGYSIVCGLGDRGLHITEKLREKGVRVAVIERDEHAPTLGQARATGAVVIIGDASEPGVLRKMRAWRAEHVFAVCADDGDNAEIAVRMRELAREHPDGPLVTVIAHIYDTELMLLLREHMAHDGRPRGIKLHFFNVPDRGARAMLEAVPPRSLREGKPPRIAVVGAGKLGRSLALKAAKDWIEKRSPDSLRLQLILIDGAAETKAELLRIRFSQIAEETDFDDVCELEAETMPKNAPRFESGDWIPRGADGGFDLDAVYTCPDDDVHSLVAALDVQRLTRGSGIPIAVRMRSSGGLSSLLEREGESDFPDLRPVGVLDYACDPEVLLAAAARDGDHLQE